MRRILQLRIRSNDRKGTRLINSFDNAATRFRQRVSVRRVRTLGNNTRRHITKFNRLRRLLNNRPQSRQRPVRTHQVFKHPCASGPRVVTLPLRFYDPLRNQVKNTITLVTRHVSRGDSDRQAVGTLFGPIFTRYLVLGRHTTVTSTTLPRHM